ncbi:hypothetical protein [Gluconobacter cerinus]|uniref:hypothetical protein n=1 Tax=Gluconobacter cerinus TaxID=38307 RepID=UPI001C056EC1|nr:hypothetical protein [Gluconobacter cerinus]
MAFSGFNLNALAPTPLDKPDPIGWAQKGVEYRNALLGNQIRQSEYDAQKAQGAAYAHHYNALTGKYDIPAVQAEMGSTEAGQFGLPEAVTTLGSQKTQQIGNESAELTLSQRRAGMIAGIAAPYLRKEGLTKGDLAPAYGTAVAHGLMSLDQAQQSYASLPEGGDELKQQVRGLTDAAIGPEHAYNDAYGSMQLVDVGGHLQWQNVGSAASGQGGVSTGAPIGKTLSPSEATAPLPYNDADGKPRIGTRADVVRANGQGQYLDGTSKPTVPLSVMGDGSYPAQPGSGTGAQPGGFSAGPAPGQVDAQIATAKAGAEGANALMQAASGRNERMAMLGNMQTDLTHFQPGPGSDHWRKLGAIFNNYSPWAFGESHIEAAQSFDKWAQNVANAQASALGHSDARLAAAEHAMPNSKMQAGTISKMLHELSGNEDAINAKANAWKASGLQPAQYQTWEQNFNQNFSPRAFQLLRMTPAERETAFKEMRASGQLEDFKKTYNAMAAAGLVPSGR